MVVAEFVMNCDECGHVAGFIRFGREGNSHLLIMSDYQFIITHHHEWRLLK